MSALLAVVTEAEKACTRCGEVKPARDYYRDNRASDGLDCWCKICRREGVKRYRENNHAKIAARKLLDEKTAAGKARIARYRHSEKGRATNRAAEKARRDELSDDYVRRCLLGDERAISTEQLTPELVEMKRFQLATRRLARQLKKELTHESSKNIDRIPEQHGRSGNTRRLAEDCGEQPAGAGPQGNKRH